MKAAAVTVVAIWLGLPFACFAQLGCGRTETPTIKLTSATLPSAPQGLTTSVAKSAAECSADDRPLPNRDRHEPAGLGGCPPGMAPITASPGRCIDRWEAFLVEVGPGGREVPFSPYENPRGRSVRAKSARNAVPQGYMDATQAARACAAADKRLCSDSEWVAACRGAEARSFPYGNEQRLGACNDHRERNAALSDLDVADAGELERLRHPCVNQLVDTVVPTGSKPACATSDRVYDLVGNVHEWTTHEGGSSGSGVAFRGGYYGDTQQNGRGCSYVTTAHGDDYWDYSTGFRCCADRP